MKATLTRLGIRGFKRKLALKLSNPRKRASTA
jgi:hypothetical protein